MNFGNIKSQKSKFIMLFLCIVVITAIVIGSMLAQDSDENSINVKLFFLSPDGNSYISEDRSISKYGTINDQIKIVLLELIKGPTTNLSPTIPQGTDIREVFVDAKHCAYVDFSRAITKNHIGGSTMELATVASIVNSLTANFPKDIQKVRILIDGREAQTIAGHIDITKPIYPF